MDHFLKSSWDWTNEIVSFSIPALQTVLHAVYLRSLFYQHSELLTEDFKLDWQNFAKSPMSWDLGTLLGQLKHHSQVKDRKGSQLLVPALVPEFVGVADEKVDAVLKCMRYLQDRRYERSDWFTHDDAICAFRNKLTTGSAHVEVFRLCDFLVFFLRGTIAHQSHLMPGYELLGTKMVVCANLSVMISILSGLENLVSRRLSFEEYQIFNLQLESLRSLRIGMKRYFDYVEYAKLIYSVAEISVTENARSALQAVEALKKRIESGDPRAAAYAICNCNLG